MESRAGASGESGAATGGSEANAGGTTSGVSGVDAGGGGTSNAGGSGGSVASAGAAGTSGASGAGGAEPEPEPEPDPDPSCFDQTCPVESCTPGRQRCFRGAIYTCNEGGVSISPTASCPAASHCTSGRAGTYCAHAVCVAGARSCVGNTGGVCREDEQGLSSAAEDCSASGQVCNVSGQCVESAFDEVSTAKDFRYFGLQLMTGTTFEVSSSRRLTELSFRLKLDVACKLRFSVFKAQGEQFTLVAETTADVVAGDGWFSSGPVDYVLEAGGLYALLVSVAEGGCSGLVYMQEYYPVTGWAPLSMASFAHAVGGIWTGYEQPFSTGHNYYLRLYTLRTTTELP